MASAVKRIPEGFNTVSPHLIVRKAGPALDFYKNAFGAEEVMRLAGPGGDSIMHAELKIGNSMIMVCDEFPQMGCKSPEALGGSPVTIHLSVENADAVYKRATDAGATAVMPMTNMFWGDRYGQVKDPFGHTWSIATHIEDVSPEECAKRATEAFSGSGCGGRE